MLRLYNIHLPNRRGFRQHAGTSAWDALRRYCIEHAGFLPLAHHNVPTAKGFENSGYEIQLPALKPPNSKLDRRIHYTQQSLSAHLKRQQKHIYALMRHNDCTVANLALALDRQNATTLHALRQTAALLRSLDF